MEIIIKGILAFAGMNTDDVFVLLLIYSNTNYRVKEVITGQYLGTLLLFTAGFIFSFLDILLPKEYMGLLGWVPLCIGLKAALSEMYGHYKIKLPKRRTALSAIAATTIIIVANGSNNIGAYIPLFSYIGLGHKIILFLVFMVLTIVWCYIPLLFSRYPAMVKIFRMYGRIVHPAGLIILGLYILFTNGTYIAFF